MDQANAIQRHGRFLGAGILADQPLPLGNGLGVRFLHHLVLRLGFLKIHRALEGDLAEQKQNLRRAIVQRVGRQKGVE